jgi:hypothetical protein
MPICFPWLQYGSAQTPHEHRHSSSSATCKATGSLLNLCPAPTEALPANPNPIALPHPPRQRLPSNGPIKTAPRKISAHSCLIVRGSPDRVLSFTGTDRGLLRSVLGPWSPVPKCEAPGAPISMEEHTSMAPKPRGQSQNPPLQKSSAIPALPWPSKLRLRYSPGFAPTTRLNALLNAASDS